MSLELQPITQREAWAFIRQHHRHHGTPQGWLFGIAANDDGRVAGVIVIGRPVARHLQDGYTAEVTRCCTDGTKNAASMLYAAAWRAARAIGFKKLVTYTLASEAGTSLKASGWKVIGSVKGRSWSRPLRPRVDTHPLDDKVRWEAC